MKFAVILFPFLVVSSISSKPQGKKEGFRVSIDTIHYIQTGRDLSLQYSTLIGGSGWDYGHGIAVDDSGYAYVAGQANSSDYPATIKSFDKTHNGGSDILLTKLSRNGSALVYSTYIGGSGRDDTRKIFIDKKGCVYLSGATESSDFPFTDNALPGNSMGYFLKVNAAGDSLIYSNRLVDGGNVMRDLDGNLVVVGTSETPDFPTTENALFRKFAGDKDIFITKIDPVRNRIIFSTFIGGSGNDWAPAMTIDHENNIIIAGRTNSADFPLKGAAFGKFTQGKFNIIVVKIKADGSELVYSTLVGGTDDDWAFDIASDENNDVYVTGGTKSSDFLVSKNAFDNSYNGGDDAILFKLNSNGTEIKYSTYLGGSLKDSGRGVVVDKNGSAYVTGCTRSVNFPVSDHAYDKTFNGAGTDEWAWGDPFLLVMNPEGSQIEYSTYFGGGNDEEAYGIALDPKGGIYLCGVTSSDDFPTTEGAYDRTKNGNANIYVAKFQFGNNNTDYLEQTPPGDIPLVFARGIVSDEYQQHGAPSFSPDGNELFWQTNRQDNDKNWLIFSKTARRINGKWTSPEDSPYGSDAVFSPDGKRLYFGSKEEGADPYFIEKNGIDWSQPKSISLISRFPELKFAYNLSIASNGTLYFLGYAPADSGLWNNYAIYRAELKNGQYVKPELLSSCINASGDILNWTPYIAPDESYLIFCSRRLKPKDDYGDLFICFRKPNGSWTDRISLGELINTTGLERFPSVSPDGKYLFFTRWTPDNDEDVFWVSASIIEKLRVVINKKK